MKSDRSKRANTPTSSPWIWADSSHIPATIRCRISSTSPDAIRFPTSGLRASGSSSERVLTRIDAQDLAARARFWQDRLQ